MTTEIFWIRTLVDFAGVAVLLSMQDRWQDMQTQHELTAIQTLLKRQYENTASVVITVKQSTANITT